LNGIDETSQTGTVNQEHSLDTSVGTGKHSMPWDANDGVDAEEKMPPAKEKEEVCMWW
jgi:hypothetical protein